MKSKFSKKAISLAATVTILGSLVTSAVAASGTAGGGWIEGKGYFNTPNAGFSTLNEKTYPEKHKGDAEFDDREYGQVKRAVAETWWKGVYHYSRAKLVWIWDREDSGRKWDDDYTYAATDWGNTSWIAYTYWGNEE
ncbi:hypothetical protein [Paenibacillus sp. OSY-SE]|uniref:hypothetical protein n=1 Tax=Paenibacillus sp. OSY-SE TaxID=1196323 RepID=UPI00036E07E0|nr:hypothetical protein [Paenibacillus sp. OSY-SE]